MLLIAVSYRRCGRNLWAKLDTVINSLSTNHAYLKTLYAVVLTASRVKQIYDFYVLYIYSENPWLWFLMIATLLLQWKFIICNPVDPIYDVSK